MLVVEDDPDRRSFFAEELRACDVRWAYNAGDAIALLEKIEFDCIFLDYDLSVRGGEGRTIAKALASGQNRTSKVIVHSMSLAGALEIRKTLPQCEIIPLRSLRGRIHNVILLSLTRNKNNNARQP